MNKGLAAISNQIGRRLGYAVTSGQVFSSSTYIDPGDPAPADNNLVTDDGTLLVTDDGTEIIYSQ